MDLALIPIDPSARCLRFGLEGHQGNQATDYANAMNKPLEHSTRVVARRAAKPLRTRASHRLGGCYLSGLMH